MLKAETRPGSLTLPPQAESENPKPSREGHCPAHLSPEPAAAAGLKRRPRPLSRLFRVEGAGFASLPGDWLNPEVIPEDRVAAAAAGGGARFGTMSW